MRPPLHKGHLLPRRCLQKGNDIIAAAARSNGAWVFTRKHQTVAAVDGRSSAMCLQEGMQCSRTSPTSHQPEKVQDFRPENLLHCRASRGNQWHRNAASCAECIVANHQPSTRRSKTPCQICAPPTTSSPNCCSIAHTARAVEEYTTPVARDRSPRPPSTQLNKS